MKNNIWSALWKNGFSSDQYIYHYTSFETALKILDGDRFRLSSLSCTNDTTEQKVRLVYAFEQPRERKDEVLLFEQGWRRWTANAKLLCFSTDARLGEISNPDKIRKSLFDVTGRGFALPRMWAQYASNNCGVCIVVNKKKIIEKAKAIYPELLFGAVSYYDWLKGFGITEEEFKKQVEIFRHNPNTVFPATRLLKDEPFSNYYFFSKVKDWEHEREFRLIVPTDNKAPLFIEGANECIEGLVVGEHMDHSQISAIRAITDGNCPLRRIIFQPTKCTVHTVNDNFTSEGL